MPNGSMEDTSPTEDLNKKSITKGVATTNPSTLVQIAIPILNSLFQFTTYSLLLVRISMVPPLLVPVNISLVVNSH